MEIKNNEYVDKCLGDHITGEQSAAIARADFSELPIGSYWNIGGTKYRIMAHDQFYAYKDITTHHVVAMPDDAYSLQKYNTGNTNGDGYYNSELKSYIEETYNPYITSIFGENHILSHTHDLTSGSGSNGTLRRTANTKAWLINIRNVTGRQYINETNYSWQTADETQFPAFIYDWTLSKDANGYSWWLGTTYSSGSVHFCYVTSSGSLGFDQASNSFGVRPAFLVY